MNNTNKIEQLKKFLGKTSTKITFGIVLITIFILTYISIFAVSVAESEFQSATVKFTRNGFVVVAPPELTPVDVIKAEFSDKLIKTIFLAGVLGVVLTLAAGIIISFIITYPLRQITKGIQDLKTNKLRTKLEPTGESEFDDVIAEFNSLTESLTEQENLRKELISDVTHELKTPLTSLTGQLEGIKDGVLTYDAKRLAVLISDVSRLKNLVDLLQDYSTLRSKTMHLDLKELNFHDLAENLIESMKVNLKDSHFEIKNKIPNDYVITADQTILQRILQNIIDNSIKYSQGDTIEISATTKEISIADNGIGIPQDDREKIFERFYRIEKSRNRKTGGLGLGLALVREMVEAHNWSIEVIDNNPGANFVIELKDKNQN